MVGLFGFATIGLATIIDLWELLDIKRGLSWVRFLFLHLENCIPPFCCEILLLDHIAFNCVSLILLYTFCRFEK
jgi:dolichyl-phosphate-mannose--protein O-mannosyl transferase